MGPQPMEHRFDYNGYWLTQCHLDFKSCVLTDIFPMLFWALSVLFLHSSFSKPLAGRTQSLVAPQINGQLMRPHNLLRQNNQVMDCETTNRDELHVDSRNSSKVTYNEHIRHQTARNCQNSDLSQFKTQTVQTAWTDYPFSLALSVDSSTPFLFDRSRCTSLIYSILFQSTVVTLVLRRTIPFGSCWTQTAAANLPTIGDPNPRFWPLH